MNYDDEELQRRITENANRLRNVSLAVFFFCLAIFYLFLR